MALQTDVSEKNRISNHPSFSTKKAAAKKKCRVLVFDDDPVFGALMELVGLKFDVFVKSRALADEITDVELRQADLILLDYDLESTTGLHWGTELLERKIATPVLLVSGGQEVFRHTIWPENIRGFTSKQLGPFGIFDSIFQVLGRQSAKSASKRPLKSGKSGQNCRGRATEERSKLKFA